MALRSTWSIIRQAGNDWIEHKVPRLAAAVAYYTILSLTPLLVISVAVAGSVFGDEVARAGVVEQFRDTVGPSGAEAIQAMLEHANRPRAGIVASLIGITMLLVGASGVFGELQDSLNTIWEVQPRTGRGIRGIIIDRFLSFAMVLCVGFLLLASLVLSTIISASGQYLSNLQPGFIVPMQLANLILSFAVVTVLFAMLFKFLPDVTLRWRDVWLGAAVTSVLFTLGKYLIGLYLGKAGVASPFGAAGSVVALVVWVYYAGLILFFGAELTQVIARRRGRGEPTAIAEPALVQRKRNGS